MRWLLVPLAAPLSSAQLYLYVGAGAVAELDDRGPGVGALDPEGEMAKTLLGRVRFESGFGVEATGVDLGELELPNISDSGYNVDGDLWTLGLTDGIKVDWRWTRISTGFAGRSD